MGHNNKLHCWIHYWQQQEKDTKGVGFKGAVLLKLAIENTNYCRTLCLTLMQRLSNRLYFQQSKFNEMVGAFKPFVFQNRATGVRWWRWYVLSECTNDEGTLLDVQCGRVSCDEFAVTPAGSRMHLMSYPHYLSECGVCTVSGLKHWPGVFAYPPPNRSSSVTLQVQGAPLNM